MKVELNTLKNLNFEEGETILLEAGYSATEGYQSDSTIADYLLDSYFVLSDEDGEELDRKSFVQHLNRNNDPANDDGSSDFVVKEGWEQA